MTNILFVTDVDGTLVDHGQVPRSVVEQARRFTAQGNRLTLATGRHRHSIARLAELLTVNTPCVILTGAALYDPSGGRCRRRIPLCDDVRTALAEILRTYPDSLAIQVFTAEDQFNLRLNRFLRENGIPEEIDKPDADLSALRGAQILKVGLCCEDTSLIERCAAQFFSNRLLYRWHYSFPIAAEVCHPAVSKGAALGSLLSEAELKPDLIAAAGDSANDLSLFALADIRFAPETAFPEVKKAADHIIPPPEKGGVAAALEVLMAL